MKTNELPPEADDLTPAQQKKLKEGYRMSYVLASSDVQTEIKAKGKY